MSNVVCCSYSYFVWNKVFIVHRCTRRASWLESFRGSLSLSAYCLTLALKSQNVPYLLWLEWVWRLKLRPSCVYCQRVSPKSPLQACSFDAEGLTDWSRFHSSTSVHICSVLIYRVVKFPGFATLLDQQCWDSPAKSTSWSLLFMS